MNEPHGGKLIERVASPAEREEALRRAKSYPSLTLSKSQLADVRNLALGAYSPLEGFMRQADFERVVREMRLASGVVWPIPVVLDASEEAAAKVRGAERILLLDPQGSPSAFLDRPEAFAYDKGFFAKGVFGTDDRAHPGVAAVCAMGPYLVGGEVTLLDETPPIFPEYNFSPKEARRMFAERGWQTIVAFQTRNAPHRGHEFLQKKALEQVDGLFVHPVMGEKKDGDFKDEYIVAAYEILIDRYYPREKVVLGILPHKMRYAGPREAVMHALIRKNYGCTHFVVGRDHAGVKNFYPPFAAQEIFGKFKDGEIGMTILKFPEVVYHPATGAHYFTTEVPPGETISFSGTRLRQFIENRERPPAYLIRPEVFFFLASSENSLVDDLYRDGTGKRKGFALWFTGLSQAGKTTTADGVEQKLKSRNIRLERLDGDAVREYLSKDLGFSKKDRDENIERVTFVAKLLSRHGAGVICSFISPYREVRDAARREVERGGARFVEIYCNAPLEACEKRDTKGLYQKARQGVIKNFTGISDPYEPPLKPEIELLTAADPIERNVDRVIEFLEREKLI